MHLATLFRENTAGGEKVHLQFKNEKLEIFSQDNQLLFSWSYSDVQLLQKFMEPAPASFIYTKIKQHILVVNDKKLYQEMIKHIRKLRILRNVIKRNASIFIISLVALFSMAGLYFFGGELLIKAIPWSVQESIGKRDLQSLTKESPIINETNVNRLMAKIYNPLIKVAKLEHPVTILIVESSEKNAFALPGGYIVIFTGLIKKAKEPEAIAGIIAHELAHLRHQHHLRFLGKELALKIAFLVLGNNQLERGVGEFVSLRNSRENEQQADATAIIYLEQLKISTKPLADFFQSFAKEDESITFLSTHPNTHNRVKVFLDHDNSKNNNHFIKPYEWQFIQSYLKSVKQ